LRRQYPERPLVGVGAVVVCSGKILLEKRKNDPGKGKWSIPGGLVELGENVEQTVIREVKEETGLDVEKPEHIDVVDSITEDENGKIRYHFVIIDYFVKLRSGALKASSDAEELRWVQFDQVEKFDLTGSFRAFFQRNRQKIEAFSSCH
jgi:ADP-ribose pyrophosphatase YjhB (NUDIX family)